MDAELIKAELEATEELLVDVERTPDPNCPRARVWRATLGARIQRLRLELHWSAQAAAH